MGGGSGGHITPLLAIAKRLKSINPSVNVEIISERGGKFSHLIDSAGPIDASNQIFAGKLRRYHNESWVVRLIDVKRNLLNLRDLFYLGVGFFQSLWLIYRKRPEVILIKGGYVGVPVGFAAKLLKVKYITHDSDANAGLTNRLIAKDATFNLVGMPGGTYGYKEEKTILVGVPVDQDFLDTNKNNKQKLLSKLGLPKESRVILVTGGSNGAQRLDKAFIGIVQNLLERYSDLYVIHQIGLGNEQIYDTLPANFRHRVIVSKFLKPLSDYSAIADIIVARAGATAVTEFASQNKACILIPNPDLTGGHQLKNAQILKKAKAAVVIQEDIALGKPEEFCGAVCELLDNQDKRRSLGSNLNRLLPLDATNRIADLLSKNTPKKGQR